MQAMPKVTRDKAKAERHNPLAEDILEYESSKNLRATPRIKKGKGSKKADEEGGPVPEGISRKVMKIIQEQKLEDGDTDGFPEEALGEAGEDAEDLVMDVDVDEDGFVVMPGQMSAEEERALSMFMPSASTAKEGTSLADMILQKIQEHESRADREEQVAAQTAAIGALSPKVLQVYRDIGKWLQHYKTGKMPKAFKVIPNLANWEEVLALTKPIDWSPAAMYEAVAIFSSNLDARMAQRFFNLVLLPAVRQNIAQYKKLNFHYYRSLRKALFKPAGFFKGILLPLVQNDCTLREALILGSVVGKASIPTMHVASTIILLSELTPWYGTTSIVLTALLNKKSALPARAIDSMVMHFASFKQSEEMLPLVWHRCLLVFVQRYKFELNDGHKQQLKEVLRVHTHDAIATEVRRELFAPKPGVAGPASTGAAAMDLS